MVRRQQPPRPWTKEVVEAWNRGESPTGRQASEPQIQNLPVPGADQKVRAALLRTFLRQGDL